VAAAKFTILICSPLTCVCANRFIHVHAKGSLRVAAYPDTWDQLGLLLLERLRLQLFVLGVRALLYRAKTLLKYLPADYLGLVSCLTLPETV